MQKILLRLSCIAGILLILGSTALFIAFGVTFGTLSSFGAGVLLVFGYFLYPKLSKRIRKGLHIAILLGTLFVLIMLGFIISKSGTQTVTFKENAVLVLGCGIKGKTVLPQLEDRLNKCIEYLQKNPTAIIIVSGGQGRNEDISEAEAMKHYLVKKGIKAEQIIEENLSRNTDENMQFSKYLLDSCFSANQNRYTVVCITSNYHAYRAMKLAQRYNIPATNYNAGVRWYLCPAAYFREIFSLWKFWLS